jgi:endonuclease/exonuclease/phosphatase family metal-dependent hydrolase
MACELVDKYIKKYDCPAFLVGDMNAEYNSKAVNFALSDGGFDHAHSIATDYADDGVGYHDCGLKGYSPWWDKPFECAIDHILVKGADAGAVRQPAATANTTTAEISLIFHLFILNRPPAGIVLRVSGKRTGPDRSCHESTSK